MLAPSALTQGPYATCFIQHKDNLLDWDSLIDCPGAQSQKKGQESHGEAKTKTRKPPLVVLTSVVSLGFLLSLGALAVQGLGRHVDARAL